MALTFNYHQSNLDGGEGKQPSRRTPPPRPYNPLEARCPSTDDLTGMDRVKMLLHRGFETYRREQRLDKAGNAPEGDGIPVSSEPPQLNQRALARKREREWWAGMSQEERAEWIYAKTHREFIPPFVKVEPRIWKRD